jgi:hypothetical protein
MPLPFNNSHNGKRQFACFICGVLQPDFASFKEHIRSNHEEGREYVVCPIERCSAPVRDVRVHFKACHPQEPVPKTCQMKALVWRDPKDPSKKKKKVSFKEGYFVSAKNRGRKMHYRSGWELEVYETLEKADRVIGYEVEPLAIDYWFDGKRQSYLPDLKIHLDDGSKEIWEIKPMNQTNLGV